MKNNIYKYLYNDNGKLNPYFSVILFILFSLIVLFGGLINGSLNIIYINLFKFNEYNLTTGCLINKEERCNYRDKLICYNNNFSICIATGCFFFIFEFIVITIILLIIKSIYEKYIRNKVKDDEESENNQL
jgi:hypothetical protein